MNDLILTYSNEVGATYVLYILLLMLFNSLAKIVFTNEYKLQTKKLIATVTTILFIAFWANGAKFVSLFFYTFFAFGFFDFIGRYIEKLLILIIALIFHLLKKVWSKIKSLFDFRLYNK